MHLCLQGLKQTVRVVSQSVIVGLCMLPAACSTTGSSESAKIEVVETQLLSQDLVETSGLFCENMQTYTINDSGNSPTLFTLDASGTVIDSQQVAKKNSDWEAVTADSEYFYIGDFGNNGGKRTNLSIVKVSRTNPEQYERLSISYEGYDVRKNEYYAHDYDAEAMVAHGSHLILFSKSWLTRKLKIYFVDKSAKEQVLSAKFEVSGIPGVITGADWDSYNKRFIVVGYSSNALGIFKPFIATLSEQFELLETYKLDGFAQVEGLCVMGDNDIWLTQENSPFSAAKLFKIKLPSGL
ncbi:hypothetical protein BFC17_02730 [Alteromonas lipolytica]|uniref:Phytase-like domain-containing protein n=2 Tax=Alteromonas lipolytica TaxID=1856405 RepID=A0A1E8FDD5_9ALTE|nr:hypothetical protein BFC17_02730 [Alteromonas lipolytica]